MPSESILLRSLLIEQVYRKKVVCLEVRCNCYVSVAYVTLFYLAQETYISLCFYFIMLKDFSNRIKTKKVSRSLLVYTRFSDIRVERVSSASTSGPIRRRNRRFGGDRNADQNRIMKRRTGGRTMATEILYLVKLLPAYVNQNPYLGLFFSANGSTSTVQVTKIYRTPLLAAWTLQSSYRLSVAIALGVFDLKVSPIQRIRYTSFRTIL